MEARYWASRTAVYIHCQYSRSNISSGHTLKKARCLYLPMLSDASCDEPQFMCLFRIRVRYAYGAKTHGSLSRVRHSNWAVCKVLYLCSVEVSTLKKGGLYTFYVKRISIQSSHDFLSVYRAMAVSRFRSFTFRLEVSPATTRWAVPNPRLRNMDVCLVGQWGWVGYHL